jgi:hypothetical protein
VAQTAQNARAEPAKTAPASPPAEKLRAGRAITALR